YTETVRPDTAYTNAQKTQQLADWNYEDQTLSHYEEDHRVALEIGGADDAPGNLWPEHYAGTWGARTKDTLEHELPRRVCSAEGDPDHIELDDARTAIK